MSTPADRHPFDPVSEAIGELRAEMRGVRTTLEHLDTRVGRLEDRMWWVIGIVVTGLLAQVGTLVAVLVRAH